MQWRNEGIKGMWWNHLSLLGKDSETTHETKMAQNSLRSLKNESKRKRKKEEEKIQERSKEKKTRFVRRELTSFNLWESDFLSKFQDAITSVQDQSKNPKKCSQLSYKIKAATFNSISSRRKMNEVLIQLLVECGPTNCVNFQPKSCCGKRIVIWPQSFRLFVRFVLREII